MDTKFYVWKTNIIKKLSLYVLMQLKINFNMFVCVLIKYLPWYFKESDLNKANTIRALLAYNYITIIIYVPKVTFKWKKDNYN